MVVQVTLHFNSFATITHFPLQCSDDSRAELSAPRRSPRRLFWHQAEMCTLAILKLVFRCGKESVCSLASVGVALKNKGFKNIWSI